MPMNGDSSANADKLSGIEEETDLYEAFAPHVDTTQITVIPVTPPGEIIQSNSWNALYYLEIIHSFKYILVLKFVHRGESYNIGKNNFNNRFLFNTINLKLKKMSSLESKAPEKRTRLSSDVRNSVVELHKLQKTRSEICKALGISRDSVNRILKTIIVIKSNTSKRTIVTTVQTAVSKLYAMDKSLNPLQIQEILNSVCENPVQFDIINRALRQVIKKDKLSNKMQSILYNTAEVIEIDTEEEKRNSKTKTLKTKKNNSGLLFRFEFKNLAKLMNKASIQ